MESEHLTLTLEILKSGSQLKMSLGRPHEFAQTVRQYSQTVVAFEDIRKLCDSITMVLNKCRHGQVDASVDCAGQLRRQGQLLWEQLLTRTVKDKLKKASEKNLILSIDEELVSVPWELLFDGEDFLGLKFNLGRIIRAVRPQESIPRYRSPCARLRMLILADPTNDLHAAYREGLEIRNQFDKARDRIAIDFKSGSIDTLYVKNALREYDIVHFAGHCEYDKNESGTTGWVLRDGRFCTHDILAMGESALLPSLIFSNGCQSARVSAGFVEQDYQERTYSLASAFLYAGVRHYIGCIQRIEDRVSFTFAKEFYSRLLKGESAGESLRKARLHLIREYGPDSLFWASYLLYGDPDFAYFALSLPRPARPARSMAALVKKYRREAIALAVAAVFWLMVVWVVQLVPSLRPTTYYLHAQARQLLRAGKNAQAAGLLNRIAVREPGFLPGYPLLAEACERMGNSQEALKYYFEYSLQSQSKNDNAHLAASYNLLGWYYHRQGNYPKAFEFYEKALTASRRHQDTLNEAIALRRLALWYRDKGQTEKALELLTKSAELNRERQWSAQHRYNLACDYFDLGLVFMDKDDYSSARVFYAKSRAVFERMHLKKELSDYYFNLGEVYLSQKEYSSAMECYRQGLAIDQVHDNKPAIAQDLTMIAELYQEMDNDAEAENYFKQAEAIASQIGARPELAELSYGLGLLYKKAGQKNRARTYLRQAQEIYRAMDLPEQHEVQDALLTIDNQ